MQNFAFLEKPLAVNVLWTFPYLTIQFEMVRKILLVPTNPYFWVKKYIISVSGGFFERMVKCDIE